MKTNLAKKCFLSKLCFRTFSFKTQAEYVFVVGLLLSGCCCQALVVKKFQEQPVCKTMFWNKNRKLSLTG